MAHDMLDTKRLHRIDPTQYAEKAILEWSSRSGKIKNAWIFSTFLTRRTSITDSSV